MQSKINISILLVDIKLLHLSTMQHFLNRQSRLLPFSSPSTSCFKSAEKINETNLEATPLTRLSVRKTLLWNCWWNSLSGKIPAFSFQSRKKLRIRSKSTEVGDLVDVCKEILINRQGILYLRFLCWRTPWSLYGCDNRKINPHTMLLSTFGFNWIPTFVFNWIPTFVF